MGKRFLITGGAGFIGSHLAERPLGDGHAVVVLDDLSTGREANTASLRGNARFQIVRDSVENEPTVNTLLSQCDAVYHLAAAVGVQLIGQDTARVLYAYGKLQCVEHARA